MKKRLFIFLFFALILTSCGPDLIKFNDSLINYVDRAHQQTNVLENLVPMVLKQRDFEKVADVVPSLVDSLSLYINAVNMIETPKGGENFKTGVVKYLNSLVVMVESYNEFSNISENSSKEEIDSVTTLIISRENESERLFDSVQKIQVAFAKENNLTLQ